MKQNIEVAIRTRPLLGHEYNQSQNYLKIDEDKNIIKVKSEDRKKQFRFNQVIQGKISQSEVFEKLQMTQFLSKVVEGFNATIFAYGQTGSGKTYTMEGVDYNLKNNRKNLTNQEDDDFGLIPRSIQTIFDLIKKNSANSVYKVYFSFLQIYNEKIYDLLAQQNEETQALRVRWSKQTQFTVENLYVIEIEKFEEGYELFRRGIKNKIMASHKLNLQSSRSHCILTLKIEQFNRDDPENVIHSKIQLVDLAGSERTALTGVEGKQQKEAIEINKSLFTLRQVIQIIAEQQNSSTPNKQSYVPYRDSKLTQLLKSSIGGQSFCKMIACIAPCDGYLEENLSTLNYATLTSNISNIPVINEDPKIRQIRELKQKVKDLTKYLKQANDHITFLSNLTGQKVVQFGSENNNNNQNDIESSQNLKLKSIKSEQIESTEQKSSEQEQIQNNIQRREKSEKSLKSPPIQPKVGNFQSPPKNKTEENADKQQDIKNQNVVESDSKLKNINTNLQKLDSHISSPTKNNQNMVKGLIESVNMVRDLLQTNIGLRQEHEETLLQKDNLEKEINLAYIENQDLRDRIDILENLMDQNIQNGIKQQNKEILEQGSQFNCKKALNMIDEIIFYRKERRKHNERIQFLESENQNLQVKLYPNSIRYQEPRRNQQFVSRQGPRNNKTGQNNRQFQSVDNSQQNTQSTNTNQESDDNKKQVYPQEVPTNFNKYNPDIIEANKIIQYNTTKYSTKILPNQLNEFENELNPNEIKNFEENQNNARNSDFTKLQMLKSQEISHDINVHGTRSSSQQILKSQSRPNKENMPSILQQKQQKYQKKYSQNDQYDELGNSQTQPINYNSLRPSQIQIDQKKKAYSNLETPILNKQGSKNKPSSRSGQNKNISNLKDMTLQNILPDRNSSYNIKVGKQSRKSSGKNMINFPLSTGKKRNKYSYSFYEPTTNSSNNQNITLSQQNEYNPELRQNEHKNNHHNYYMQSQQLPYQNNYAHNSSKGFSADKQFVTQQQFRNRKNHYSNQNL